MLIRKNMKLAEVIHHDHTLVPIINRFGIHLGFGNNNIAEICRKHNINIDFFVTILNAFHDTHYFPQDQLRNFPASLLIDYLQKAHRYFLDDKIPEIAGLINKMTAAYALDETTTKLLSNFFTGYSQELKKHIQYEEKTIYPYILSLEKTEAEKSTDKKPFSPVNNFSISDYETQHENVEEKLFDLKNIIIKYLPEPKDDKPGYRLLRELFTLEKELNEHARIEDMILVPKVKAMEKALKNKKE